MELKQAVAKRLKNILGELGITQYELYKRSGVPQSTISTILNSNIKTVKLSTIYEICSGIGMELSDFFDINFFKLENIND